MKLYKTLCVGVAALGAGFCSNAQSVARPNVIVVLVDDMGYSDLGCYGGEVETPNLNSLAQGGLRYRQFYNNARSCPSRAVLLTGLYPHQAGMGWMAAADLQLPAYQGRINENCVTLGEVMKRAGYSTYMTGKWHLSGDRQNNGGVQDCWPKQRGFDSFYGIVNGASNYFTPEVYTDNQKTQMGIDEPFYFTHAISAKSVEFIDHHSFDKNPLFMYVSYTAPHWPLHALQQDIDKYTERYKEGWDRLREQRFARQKQMGLFGESVVLSPGDANVPAWSSLNPAQQQEFAMRMAIYAAQIDAVDQGIGRIVAKLKEKNQLDNTLIMFMSDNGACAEFVSSGPRKTIDGKQDTWESYRINWANLSSTPYREYKHYTNEGGIASPMIVHYPNGVRKDLEGRFVDEYGHFADVMATCVELSGYNYPRKYNGNNIVPMQGVSLLPNFVGAKSERTVTFWEHEANIAMRDGKWKMVVKTDERAAFDPKLIELYDMESDPTEMNNLAAQYPQRVAQMYAQWNLWAEKVGVFPLDTRDYGQRMQAYKRDAINGEFNCNFGDWNIENRSDSAIDFSIDTKNTISGGRTARIDIPKATTPIAKALLKWVFTNSNKTSALVSFKGRSSLPIAITFRVEKLGKTPEIILDQRVELKNKTAQFSFPDLHLLPKERYQLVFIFDNQKSGVCWIDDVKLKID